MPSSKRNIIQLIGVFTVMSIAGIIAFTLRFVSFGLLTNFNRKYIISNSSKLILIIVGIKVIYPVVNNNKSERYFYTFNHNSYLDILILSAMGLTNTKYLISVKTIKIIPVTIAIIGIGGLHIPMQNDVERRLKFFKKLANSINSKNFNVAGASEGVHDHHHGIDKFNRGVYHMATICNMKIVPLFIYIPIESNPFNKYKPFKRGTISVEQMDIIDTSSWKVDDVDENKEQIRAMFVKRFNELNQATIS